MPRISGALTDNACYHLINRGNGRQQVFHKEGDYRSFIDLLQQAREKFQVQLHAWCLISLSPYRCSFQIKFWLISE
jgi:putative transposase